MEKRETGRSTLSEAQTVESNLIEILRFSVAVRISSCQEPITITLREAPDYVHV